MKILSKVLISISILYALYAIFVTTVQWFLRFDEIKGFSWKNKYVDLFLDFVQFCPSVVLYLIGKYLGKKTVN